MQVQKKGAPTEIGHSRGGASTKIHAVVDAYGNPVHLMINEGQRNDIVYAIPLLEQVKIPEDSQIFATMSSDEFKKDKHYPKKNFFYGICLFCFR